MVHLWEQWQNSDMNATPYFYTLPHNPVITQSALSASSFPEPERFWRDHRGPIIKDKLFFFGLIRESALPMRSLPPKIVNRASGFDGMTAVRRES